MLKKKIPINDVRAALESLKEHVRTVIVAFQEGSGSQDAPFTADLAVAAIWREIDIRGQGLGTHSGTSWFRCEVQDVPSFTDALAALQPASVDCVGPRKDYNTVCYVTFAERVQLATILALPGLVGVRDWRWY